MKNMKKSFQLAGAYIGLIIGAGFASGQEIMQFFTSFGIYSILASVIAAVLFSLLGMHVMQLGTRYQVISHKKILYKICGRHLGGIVDILITFFLFGVAVVMIAGSGSIFSQQFGLSPTLGNLLLTALVIITLCLNVNKVITIISSITPYLLIMIFIIAGYSVFTSNLSMVELNDIALSQPQSAPNWLMGGILYVSYNIAAGIAMLAVVGGTVKDEKVSGRGGFLGGLGLGLLVLLINIAMFMNIDKIADADMPTLLLAAELSPFVEVLMTIALLGMIFNTAVGMLYAFVARFIEPGTKRFRIAVVLSGTVAYLSSYVGFVTLVGTVYPITGYLGLVLIVAIIISFFKTRNRKEQNQINKKTS